MKDPDSQLRFLLAGFRRGMGYGALAGFLVYAAILLSMNPAQAGPLLGVSAGMVAAVVGGAAVGGLLGAYLRLLKYSKE